MAVRWNDRALKRQLTAALVENATAAGKLVEGDARQRIMAIQDPDWGTQYRGYVARLITSEVTTERRAVVIRVGVRRSYTKWHGYYIELGTSRRAAHPYLRPAVFQNGAKIVALLSGG